LGPPAVYTHPINSTQPTNAVEPKIRLLLYRRKSSTVKIPLRNITTQDVLVKVCVPGVSSGEELFHISPKKAEALKFKVKKQDERNRSTRRELRLSYGKKEYVIPMKYIYVSQSSLSVSKKQLQWDSVPYGTCVKKELVLTNTGEDCELQVSVNDRSNSLFSQFHVHGKRHFAVKKSQKISIFISFEPSQNVEHSHNVGTSTSVAVLRLEVRPMEVAKTKGWFRVPNWAVYEVVLIGDACLNDVSELDSYILHKSQVSELNSTWVSISDQDLLKNDNGQENSGINQTTPCDEIIKVEPQTLVISGRPDYVDVNASLSQSIAPHFNQTTELTITCLDNQSSTAPVQYSFEYNRQILGIRPNCGELRHTESKRIIITSMLDSMSSWDGNISLKYLQDKVIKIPIVIDHMVADSVGNINPMLKSLQEDSSMSECSNNLPNYQPCVGIYFRGSRLVFPRIELGTVYTLKVQMCNASAESVEVTLEEPELPFIITKKKLTLGGKRFVYLPVKFIPVKCQQVYESVIVAKSANSRCTLELLSHWG